MDSHSSQPHDRTTPVPIAHRAVAVLQELVDPADQLEEWLETIDERNAGLNAIVTEDRAEARRRCLSLRTMPRERLGPLAGLPFTVKDTIETAGMRTTAGSSLYDNHVPTRDAPAVAMLRDLGAVLIGKTNVPPLAADYETSSPLFGTTMNPHDADRTVGGSSGGGAAAVAAGMTAFDLGSDSVGSLSVSAHYCGVASFKPSPDAIPNAGHIPPGSAAPCPPSTRFGLLARDVADLCYVASALLRDIVPTDDADVVHEHPQLAVWLDDAACPLDDQVRAGMDRALARCGSASWGVHRLSPNETESLDLAGITRAYARVLGADSAPAVDPIVIAQRMALVRAGRRGPMDLAYETAVGMLTALNGEAHDREKTESHAVIDLFKRFDAIVVPPSPVVAFPHSRGPRRLRTLTVQSRPRPFADQAIYPSIAGLAGLPSVAVPVPGLPGLPVGLHVLGPPGRDWHILELARRLSIILATGADKPPYELHSHQPKGVRPCP